MVLLHRLSMNANVKLLKAFDEEKMDQLLKTLPDSPAAKYCSTEAESFRGGCTPNTRVDLLEQLRTWACDDQAPKIYWLNGMAGTGKTTIAYSLCEYLQSSQKLGASFFCSQRLPGCRDVSWIVPSISYRLSLFSVPFRHALVSVLQADKDAYNQPLQKQFDVLFAKPLQDTTDTFPANVVIVIDALDECDDQGGVAKVISTLLSHAAGLPVKFFVTSRPEAKIVDQMRKKEAAGVRRELRLHELKSTVVRQDIATYLTAKLTSAGLSDAELNTLVRRSGVLFIYAATVVRFIEFDNFSGYKQRLQLVLDASAALTNESDEALDDLYTAILKNALELKGLTRAEKAAREAVLRHVVCAREPLSLDVIAGLLEADTIVQVSSALRPLQSVLSVSSESEAIGTLHESFPNYLLHPTRSGRFHCDPGRHHAQMAQQCFHLIKVPSPPFNICNLESSYLLDDEVPDLDQRIDQAVSQALSYACRYWAAHLELADHSHNLLPLLYEFLSERLLLWMEVMNLKKHMWEGADALRQAQRWCKGRACSDDLQPLVQDAKKLASVVLSGPVLRSTPHIYISALALWPKSRPVTRHYLPRFPGLAKVTGTANLARHELTPTAIDLRLNAVWDSIACSPNSKYIGFVDKSWSLTIWNYRTGRRETSAREIMEVNCFAFSHDGLHVMLGRSDGTVWTWDTQTHEMIGDPLRCHNKHPIRSVVCSPDGEHVSAGSSRDNRVYIWSRRTGQIIASLPGHTYGVRSVAYSPDGAYITSVSQDGTIRIWNVYSSYTLERELSGYTEGVNSISLSPDGAHVASLSSNCTTIRVWDVRTGALVRKLLNSRHDIWFTSVQYSPSGLHLVTGVRGGGVYIRDPLTGRILTRLLEPKPPYNTLTWLTYSLGGEQLLAWSSPGTLHIWHWRAVEAEIQRRFEDSVKAEQASQTDLDDTPAELDIVDRVERVRDTDTPRTAGKSPESHDEEVSALAYSPDGAYIVSGSWDYTLRIWDARTGRMAGQPLKGHTAVVLSVSFSPDGARIVSGSCDNTIRVWDVGTGNMLGTPLIGHTDLIRSASYSPDGARIASGSDDKTIRIWDAYTGQMVGSPLIGHAQGVNSVAYSPGGAFLVSGSTDRTIRVWSTRTGRTEGRPFEGQASSVESVAYSPNGLYIVSRSWGTVRVWDAYMGSMVGRSCYLDPHELYSISYSSAGANLSLSYLNRAIYISHTHTERDL
ncbi:hypothetical protein FRC09_005052, partial [Ceratobasidium sp. 395]